MSPTVWKPSRLVLLELVVLLVVVGEHRRRCARTARRSLSGPVPVTTLPSSSNSRISTIGAALPHEPGLRSWSSGRRIVFTPSSVEPYTSNSDSAGKSREVLLLEGEAPRRGVGDHQPHRRRSYFAFTSSGRLQIIRIGVGARERRRRPGTCRRGAASPRGSNLRCSTIVWPSAMRDAHEPAGPGVVQRPGGDVDVVGPVADELHHRRAPAPGRRRCAGSAPFGLPVVPRRVDHRGAGVGRRRRLRRRGPLARRRRRDQLVGTGHPAERRAVEHEDRAATLGISARIRSNSGANSAST